MKIEISGRLKHRNDQLKANLTKKLKIFGPRVRRQEDISTTLVGAYLGHRPPLDELAKGLASDMEMQNYHLSPVVVPDTQTVSFQQVAFDATSSTNSGVQYASVGSSDHAPLAGMISQPVISLNGQALNTLDRIHDLDFQQRTAPTLENLAQAGQFFKPPIRLEDDCTNTSVVLDYCSASTLVANEAETSQYHPESTSREKSSMPPLPRKSDEDTIQRVMEIAFLRLLIQFVVGL